MNVTEQEQGSTDRTTNSASDYRKKTNYTAVIVDRSLIRNGPSMLKYSGTSKLNKTDFLPLKLEVNRTSDKKLFL